MASLVKCLIGLVAAFVCGCAGTASGPLGAAFSVFVPPPGEVIDYVIEQGGETAFEVGTLEIHYEIQMNGIFSGSSLVISVPDLPAGVSIEASVLEGLSKPFDLETDSVRNGHFTIRANSSAAPGTYIATMTVSGIVQPGDTIETRSDTFSLTITERQ